MKIKPLCFALLILTTLPSVSQSAEVTPLDYAIDVAVYRPAGVLLTVVGGAAFVLTLPTSLIATALPPHKAVFNAANSMVGDPVRYTFIRPLGTVIYGKDSGATVEHDETSQKLLKKDDMAKPNEDPDGDGDADENKDASLNTNDSTIKEQKTTP